MQAADGEWTTIDGVLHMYTRTHHVALQRMKDQKLEVGGTPFCLIGRPFQHFASSAQEVGLALAKKPLHLQRQRWVKSAKYRQAVLGNESLFQMADDDGEDKDVRQACKEQAEDNLTMMQLKVRYDRARMTCNC